VDVERLNEPLEFLDAAAPVLMADEARHNLILSLCTTLVQDPDAYPDFHLWLVREGNQPVLAAMMTPPFNVLVSRPLASNAVPVLAQALHQERTPVPGVIAALPEVDEFVEAWRTDTGRSARLRTALGLFQLTAVRPVTGVRGRSRDAAPGDRSLLAAWFDAFAAEALPESHPARKDRALSHETIDRRLGGDGGLALWENPAPVSLAGWSGSTPNGVRIGPVYTPPDLRRRGYASALVARVSQDLLDRGRTFCFLYTDLANPTSNHIYREVGYEHVCDSADYGFEERTPG